MGTEAKWAALEAEWAKAAAESARFKAALLAPGGARTMQKVASRNYGGDLTICQISYGQVSADAVLAGTIGAESVYLSADGRSFTTSEWHKGASEDAVYVEVIRKDGRDFHGWVDASSRQLVQAG